jgi:hypothetical protein
MRRPACGGEAADDGEQLGEVMPGAPNPSVA